jgi:phosphatidylinositol-3-phosphatase
VSGDSPVPTQPPDTCSKCGSPLAGDQRYCLSCGARHGPRAPALERILQGLSSGEQAPVAPSPAPRRSRGGRAGGRTGGLPHPFTAAVLTLAMLGFGAVTGAAASNDPSGALNALRRGPLTLLVPAPPVSTELAAAPPPAEAAPTPEASPSSSTEEPSSSPEASSPSSGESHKHSGKGRSKGSGGSQAEAPKLPPVKHVFLIVLADQAYAQTFGPESPAPYIAHTLEHQGELLVRFYSVAHEELADEVALVSGLGPTPQTAADCPTFSDIIPGQANSKGQYTGQGCIYPKEAQTVGEQLTAKGLTWKVYAEGLGDVSGGVAAPGGSGSSGAAAPGGSGSSGAAAPGASGFSGASAPKAIACWHPEFGAADPTSQAPQGDTFATFRDPFTYFDGVLHSPECTHDDVGIEGLAGDLKSAKSTPALSYIVPDLCHDGRPTPCAPGAPSGLPAAETFLRRIVTEILTSPAYHKGGLLIITTDQAPTTGEYADSSSCCMQPRFPAPVVTTPPAGTTEAGTTDAGITEAGTTEAGTTDAGITEAGTTTPTAPTTSNATTPAAGAPTTTAPATTTSPTSPATTLATTPATTTPAVTTPAASTPAINLPPKGGGQVGALLISPFVKPATFDQEPFNDFSLLRTIENLFGLPPLGYAATRGLSSLEASVFSAWSGTPANSS